MPDYDCYPIWHQGESMVGNIDPEALDISMSLVQRLEAWQKEFDQTLDRDNPIESGFTNKEALAKFVVNGYELAVEIKAELKTVGVTYYDID